MIRLIAGDDLSASLTQQKRQGRLEQIGEGIAPDGLVSDPGLLRSWQRLLERCTHAGLQVGNGQAAVAIPSNPCRINALKHQVLKVTLGAQLCHEVLFVSVFAKNKRLVVDRHEYQWPRYGGQSAQQIQAGDWVWRQSLARQQAQRAQAAVSTGGYLPGQRVWHLEY